MRAPDAPSGWPSAMAPPFTLVFVAVEPELLLDREVLRREGLVDLDEVDVAELEAGALERAADGRRRADAHDRRVAAGDAPADEAARAA